MTDKAHIILNPNASVAMTEAISEAVAPFRAAGFPFRAVRSPEGPEVIASQRDADLSIAPMLALATSLEPEALGFVVGCFSDPGLVALREQTSLPVVGMQEASVSVALGLGARFGIVAMAPSSVVRQRRNLAATGMTARWAGSRVLSVGPEQYGDHARTLAAMVDAGQLLRDEDQADVVILGCAGMAGYRADLEAALGLPVVEPAQAAATLLIGRALATGPA